MCRQSHYRKETGKDLSGAFGFLSDVNAVRAFDAKWIRTAGKKTKPLKKKAAA